VAEAKKIIVGSEEWCGFPTLGIPAIKARVDSGATTSSINASNIKVVDDEVYFDVYPIQKSRAVVLKCHAKIHGRKTIKSSNGDTETRYVIKTPLMLGKKKWEVELTLSSRDSMGYRMLLGRQAMQNKMLVDVDNSFLQGDIEEKKVRGYYKSLAAPNRKLTIALLASDPELYSNKRIMQAAKKRGHKIIFINAKQSYMNISSDNPAIHFTGGQVLEYVDAVIPRLRPSITFYGCSITRQFEALGAYCLNDSTAISRSRDKLRCLQLLVSSGVPIPTTGFARSPQDTKDLIQLVGGAPLIIKLLEGTQGQGVVIADTNKAAESVINAFKTIDQQILVQEYIKESAGKDIRCFVIDDKVVGSMQREASEGEFRANLHLGGKSSSIKISKEEQKIAIKAARSMGLKVAGVDIIRSKKGPLVLEVNSSPGLEGIEKTTGLDIADLMIQSIERNIDIAG
jgi:ribosomal protein S6--L-glutamate ligase